MSENRRNGENDIYFPTYRDKYNKFGLTVDEIDYLDMIKYLDNNIISKVDSVDLISKAKKFFYISFTVLIMILIGENIIRINQFIQMQGFVVH